MNQELWEKIQAFDFDSPPGEYGFSTRLASENYWTREFTAQAILEYKKFMYLAATSDFMVSPSGIVDDVWHQHLIFTQSYQDFCSILGKQVQHLPSTRNKEEAERFRQAKERTIKFYERDFGPQPANIWSYGDMYGSLNLVKARYKIRTFLIAGILALFCLAVPAYYLLRPVYITINNPYFIYGISALSILFYIVLEIFNRVRLRRILAEADKSSFIYQLQPYELVYLKTQQLAPVITGTVNELVAAEVISVNRDNTVELMKSNATTSLAQLQVTAVLSETGPVFYPRLLRMLGAKPIFRNIENSMNAFRKYFNKSKKFATVYYINFAVLSLLFLLSFTRIMTGVLRDKPVSGIIAIATLQVAVTIVLLFRLSKMVAEHTVPRLYKKELLPERQLEGEWQWRYFLFGTAVLSASFVPLVNYVERNSSGSGSGGSSCGSSCGSNCGSSCGGCGGCGGD